MRRGPILTWGVGIALALCLGGLLLWWSRFPPDTTPEGAYLRIAHALGKGEVKPIFPYLDDDAQHAAFTVIDYRRRSLEAIEAAYPEPERTQLGNELRPVASLGDGSEYWERVARERGWVAQLRRDLSGIASVEVVGERATVVTARGTRYAFRRRAGGIWGLTLFTAELLADAERAARDFDVVQSSAEDYRRAHKLRP
jgi:hypothetical protein